jgi:hypothetical protein
MQFSRKDLCPSVINFLNFIRHYIAARILAVPAAVIINENF